jgi:trehalose 6-phosphate synthase/phosphatase
MQERVRTYDATRWVTSFMAALRRAKERQGRLSTKRLVGKSFEQAVELHRAARHRVLLLDYDGTLVGLRDRPGDAAPDPELLALVRSLHWPGQSVYVVSGRDHDSLGAWFGDIPIHLIAEHGAWLRDPQGRWTAPKSLSRGWKDQLRVLMEQYVERVPGSLLEEKDYSLVWHYRLADAELGAARAKELTDDVQSFTANLDVQVLDGKKVVEVRNSGVTKGVAAREVLEREGPDFVFAAGDDATDEDLFRALPKTAISVCVGGVHSNATYRVADPVELRGLLSRFGKT